MKKRLFLLTLVVCALLMLGSVSVFAADNSVDTPNSAVTLSTVPSGSGFFWDVEPREWYYNYVGFVGRHDIFQGYGDGEFRPRNNMTRAEVVRVLYTLDGEPEVIATDRFSDVELDAWYAREVEWAVANGIVTGYPGGVFKPQNEVSRQDFVTMLYRYANYKDYDTSGRAELDFPDASDVNEYAKEPFSWAIDAGIISGSYEVIGVLLRPMDSTNRAQVAKMLSVIAVEYEGLGKTTEAQILTSENNLTVGCYRLLQYAVAPYQTALEEMTWTSSDESVVTVSRGIIFGVSPGSAVVTATTFDGNIATCNVTVTEDSIDPYGDVVDFVGLNYNDGQWNDFPGYLYRYSEDDWDYEYGVKLDYATGSIAFASDSYYTVEQYGFETEFLTAKNSTDIHGRIRLIDDKNNAIWFGEVYFDAKDVTESTKLNLTYYSCTKMGWDDEETKQLMGEVLTNELQLWMVDMNDMFESMGIKATAIDFGFVNF